MSNKLENSIISLIVFCIVLSGTLCENSTELSITETTMVSTSIVPIDSEIKILNEDVEVNDKDSRIFPLLRDILIALRSVLRVMWDNFNFYQPELQVMKCGYQYARTEFPNIIPAMSMEKAARFVQGIYGSMVNFLQEMVMESQPETMVERERISHKINDITKGEIDPLMYSVISNQDVYPRDKLEHPQPKKKYTEINNLKSPIISSGYSMVSDQESYYPDTLARQRMDDSFIIENSTVQSEPLMTKRSDMNGWVGPRQFSSNIMYIRPSMNPLKKLKQSNMIPNLPETVDHVIGTPADNEYFSFGDTITDMFNIEPVDKKGPDLSLTLCTQRYTKDVFWRTLQGLVFVK